MRSVAIICVRALGAFLIVVNMYLFAGVVNIIIIAQSLSLIPLAPTAAPLAFMAIGIVMIVFSKSLAGLLTRGIPETASAPDARDLLHAGTALIGVFCIASAAPILIDGALDYFDPNLASRDASAADRFRMLILVTALVRATGQVLVGVALLLMARPVFGRRS